MRGVAAALVAVLFGAVLAVVPVSAGPLAASATPTPIVETGATARIGGGDFVHVRIGDVALGVVWSKDATISSGLSLFIDYVRYFGGAQIYDAQGTYLGTRALPLHTIFYQHFDRMVEFRDLNGDGLLDLRLDCRFNCTGDLPLKWLDLNRPWALDGPVEQTITNNSAWVNFTVSTRNAPYRMVWDGANRTWRSGTSADGALDRLSLTFHLAATFTQGTITVPFYRVTVANGDLRTPTASEFLGNRTVTGTTVSVNGKYDQLIEGWDFSSPDSKLAMGTSLAFANAISLPIVQWLQQQFGGACLKDGTYRQCESDAGPTVPVRIQRTDLQVGEGWQRAGDTYWTSDVTVDGNPGTMTFEIYKLEPISSDRLRGDATLYNGFRAYGAFVYPQGQTIAHDPGLAATSAIPLITETTNVTPSFLAILELAVVGLALVPALLLRRRKKTPEGKP